METRTIRALADITDEGLFERIATALLRLVPEYEGLAHTGINADGKTRKSPVDGLSFFGEGGSRLIVAHHTTTAADLLERKWLLNPAAIKRRPSSKTPLPGPGDVLKSLEIIDEERQGVPGLAATLILATNQEPDEALVREVTAVGRTRNVTIDIWTRSRLADRLDTDPRGQLIRRKLLGFEEELLSRDLLNQLSADSVAAFDAGDDESKRVARDLDNQLRRELGPVNFIVASSGSGKTIACHKRLQAHVALGGVAIVLPHTIVEASLTLDHAVMASLIQLQSTLANGQRPLPFFTEEDPLLLLVEDINRSAQPARLIEKITGWAPKANEAKRVPWKLLCPVWPHILSGISSQAQSRLEKMTLRPQPMSRSESANAVAVAARVARVSLPPERSEEIAAALGDDPLLIALNREWTAPRPDEVIERFVDDALCRAQTNSAYIAAELRSGLVALGAAQLVHRTIAPSWNDVAGWNLTSDTIGAIRETAKQGEILRLEGGSADMQLRFRHDRVRDWLLAEAALDLDGHDLLTADILGDPALAEIMGSVIARRDASQSLRTRAETEAPLALFHGLRVAPSGSKNALHLAGLASNWLQNPASGAPANATLLWQALGAIEDVEGDFMLPLVELFPSWPAGQIARVRNGDIGGGIALCHRFELSTAIYWLRRAIAAVRPHRGEAMTAQLATMLDDDADTVTRKSLIEFAGVWGDSALAPALKRLWDRDGEREALLASYLWAMARCAAPETAADLLDPICALWGALPETRDNGAPSPRDDLAGDSVRFGFEASPPTGAIDYLIERASQPDLSWQIEYALHGVDDPRAILFQVDRAAARLPGDGYAFMNQARDYWRRASEGRGTPMAENSRTLLLDIWRDPNADPYRRRAAFGTWAVGRGEADVAILQAAAGDDLLPDAILQQRLSRSDPSAIPEFIERLDGEEGLRWWYYARYLWSSTLYEALDRSLAREAEKSGERSSDDAYEIGSMLTRVIMRLPVADAERLLLRHWDALGHMMHFVQAALFVATPALLEKAAGAVQSHTDPQALFKHLASHFGVRISDEPGVTREEQIAALEPHLGLIASFDIESLADVCDENGWHAARQRWLDPYREAGKIPSAKGFGKMLDRRIEQDAVYFVDHDIDRMIKAGIPWPTLAGELRTWLSTNASTLALALVKQAVLHAGDESDLAIFEVWPGSDDTLRQAEAADAAFALRRRHIGST